METGCRCQNKTHPQNNVNVLKSERYKTIKTYTEISTAKLDRGPRDRDLDFWTATDRDRDHDDRDRDRVTTSAKNWIDSKEK